MDNMTLASLLKISLVMPVLLVCSIVMVAYALERFWAYMKIGQMDNNLAERIKQCVRQGQIKEAVYLEVCVAVGSAHEFVADQADIGHVFGHLISPRLQVGLEFIDGGSPCNRPRER